MYTPGRMPGWGCWVCRDMLIGVDFDNTIACYEGIFHRAAREKDLIPESVGASKGEVRDYLRSVGREDDWTELQGYIYGARMDLAPPYPGVLDFFRACVERSIGVCIVSHKTRHPYIGPRYDLHAAARDWLEGQGFFDAATVGLAPDMVYLELTKEAKLDRIGRLGCTHFIDDLPEFLDEPAFPSGVRKLLFDPNDAYGGTSRHPRFRTWSEIGRALLTGVEAAGAEARC